MEYENHYAKDPGEQYAMTPEAEEMWEHELKHYADCVAKIGMMLS